MELIKKRLAERPSDSRLWYVNLFYISSYFSFVFILSLFVPTIIVSKRYTSKLVSSYIYCHNYDYGFRPSIFMYVSLEAYSYSSCIQRSSLTYFQLQGIQLSGLGGPSFRLCFVCCAYVGLPPFLALLKELFTYKGKVRGIQVIIEMTGQGVGKGILISYEKLITRLF